MRRGEVWRTDFGVPRGSAAGFERPSVVVSDDRFNRSKLATVVVAPFTSNRALAAHPGNVAVAAGLGGLAVDSVVTVTLVVAVDRAALENSWGRFQIG